MAALISIAASPVTLAFAAGGTSTVKDPYGENTALGLDNVSTTSGAQAQNASTGGAIGKTILGLGVVIAVIYGLTWVLKQMKASSESSGFGGLTAEASVPLGPGRAVHLIRVGRELVLVGSAEHGVVPIRTYTEDEAVDLGLIADPADPDAEPVKSAGPLGVPVAASAVVSAVRPKFERLRERTLR
jgi:flagellar protein FliO/FliZ